MLDVTNSPWRMRIECNILFWRRDSLSFVRPVLCQCYCYCYCPYCSRLDQVVVFAVVVVVVVVFVVVATEIGIAMPSINS